MPTAFGLNPRFPGSRQKPQGQVRLATDRSIMVGLAGFWPFFEGVGQIVNDWTQKSSPGVLSSDTIWAAGKFGAAVQSGSTSGRINCGNPTSLSITGDLTLHAWVYTTASSVNGVYPRIISKLHNQSGFQSFEMLRAANDSGGSTVHGAVYLQIAKNNALLQLSDPNPITLGVWTHYVTTYNNSTGFASVYRNGVRVANSNIGANGIGSNTLGFYIGGNPDFDAWNGLIDLPAVWNRVLTDNEVAQLYNEPFSFFESVGMGSRNLLVMTAGSSFDNSLTISGTSAISSPGAGFVHSVQRSIEGLCSIAVLEGFVYPKTFQIDGTAAVAVSYVYAMEHSLTLDGTSAVTIGNVYTANPTLTVAGSAAFTINTDGSWFESLSVGAKGQIFFENIYSVLLVSAVLSGFSATITKLAPGDETASSVGSFSATGICVFRRPVTSSLILTQSVILKKPTWFTTQSLVLTQQATCYKVHVETLSQTLTLTQEAYAVRAVSQSLTLSHTATCKRVRSRTVTHTLPLDHSVSRRTVLRRSSSHTLVFNTPAAQKLPLIGSQNQTANRQFEHYFPTVNVVLVPRHCLIILGVPSQTIILPCPIWGDKEAYQGEINLKRSMTGLTYTYVKKVKTRKLNYSFELWTNKYLELRQFFIDHAEELMTLQNHNAKTWLVQLVNNPIEFTTETRWQPRGEKYNITLEFEGVKIGG